MLMQFGQRDDEPLDLSEFVETSAISPVTVHLALTLTSTASDTHLLFSRYALDYLVGMRGSFFSVLGMHDVTSR